MKIDSGATRYTANIANYKETQTTQKATETTTEAKKSSAKKDSAEISSEGKVHMQESIEKIKEQQTASFNNMISSMLGKQGHSSQIMNNASALLSKVGMGNLTPEQAAHNISEEGAYGVNAVATNIMNMAESLSGGDPEKLKLLKDAVKKGFEAAGVDLGVGGASGLPQVSLDTFTEVMKRFEHLESNGNLDSYTYTPYGE